MVQWVSNGSNELHSVSHSCSVSLLNGLIAPSFLCFGIAVEINIEYIVKSFTFQFKLLFHCVLKCKIFP